MCLLTSAGELDRCDFRPTDFVPGTNPVYVPVTYHTRFTSVPHSVPYQRTTLPAALRYRTESVPSVLKTGNPIGDTTVPHLTAVLSARNTIRMGRDSTEYGDKK